MSRNSQFIFAFFFATFFACAGFAQDQTQNQPNQTQGQEGWYQQNSSVGHTLRTCIFKNQDTGWVHELWTTNGGNSWQVYMTNLYALGFLGSFGYAESPKGNGWLAVTTNNGMTWDDYYTGLDNGGNNQIGNFYFSTPSRGFCYVATNFIGKTLDGGKTWVLDTTHMGDIESFVSFDSLHVIASGKNYSNVNTSLSASVFYSSNGGQTWNFAMKNYSPTGIGYKAFAAFDTAIVYFIWGASPRVYRSITKGNVLQPFSFSSGGFGSMDSPQGGCATDRNNITVVGTHGEIFRSYDGFTFEMQNSGISSDLYAVSFIDSLIGWAAGDNGIILHTSNAGYSWVQQQITIDTLNTQTYPNPASTNLTVGFTLPQEQHVTISILDLTGKELMHPYSNEIQPQGINYLPLNIHVLPAGAYLLHISTECYDGTCKFTKIVP